MTIKRKSPLTRDWATLQTESLKGDAIHQAWVAQLSIEPYLNESSAKVEKIKQTTKIILKNIEKYKNKIVNIDFKQPIKKLLKDIYNFFCLRHNGQSKYACYKMNNGGYLDFRLALHDGVGDNFEDPTHLNVSVYICYKYLSNRGISSTPYQEYEISPDLFEENPQMVMDALVNAVENAINTGEFILDEMVGKQIDTTVQDTPQDLIQRYGYSNSKPFLFTFIDKEHKRYNFKLLQIEECSENKIVINVLTRNGDNKIVVDSNKDVFMNNVKITPTRDIKKRWIEFVDCLRRLAKRNNKINESVKMNMNKNNNINKDMKRMICETVKRVLKESQDFESPFWYIEDDSNTINGYYDDMEEAIEDAKSFAESGWRDGRRYFVKDQNQKVIFDTHKSIFENIRKKNKQTIRLKESELKRMIAESVSKILSEGKYVNNKPIDWNKISDDDVDTAINKRSDRHYNRPNGGDVLARRQNQLDAAKRLGMEGDELDVFPDTVQARTKFYRNHPWMKPYRDNYVFPSHMKKKNELQSTEGGEGFQYLSNPSSLPAGWQ